MSREQEEPEEGGVLALRVPRKVLATRRIRVRASEIPKRRPQIAEPGEP